MIRDRANRNLRIALSRFLLISLLAGSCTAPRHPVDSHAPDSADSVVELRGRVARYWSAKATEDWSTVYGFLTPAVQASKSREEFVEWSQANEPFRILSHEVVDVQTEKERGWAFIRYASQLPRFPDAAPRATQTWQKWVRIDGAWYPVPPTELEIHPNAPAMRDAGEELRLKTRIHFAFEARQNKDWHALYLLSDPRDHDRYSEESFIRAESLVEYLSCRIDWAEVIGNRGRARVGYEHRLADPNLTKLPLQTLHVIEPWTLHEGEWYRDLDNSVH